MFKFFTTLSLLATSAVCSMKVKQQSATDTLLPLNEELTYMPGVVVGAMGPLFSGNSYTAPAAKTCSINDLKPSYGVQLQNI